MAERSQSGQAYAPVQSCVLIFVIFFFFFSPPGFVQLALVQRRVECIFHRL